jgi:hypothetical protein
MKSRILLTVSLIFILNSCVSIPKETIQLSKVIRRDLTVLQSSQKAMVELFYKEIINNINGFIEDVYAPFVINYVLMGELKNYKNNVSPSIFETFNRAANEDAEKSETTGIFSDMSKFLKAANTQIEKKRSALIAPILKQQDAIIRKINTSYQNTMHANSTITSYLESAIKVKESQNEVLSILDIKERAEGLNNSLLKVSDITKALLIQGKEIDIKSDEAFKKMESITDKIKNITNKK